MKKIRLLSALMAILALSCNSDNDPLPILEQPGFEELESEWIRVLAVDEENRLHMMNPVTGEMNILSVDPLEEGSYNHVSTSGRYITSIDRPAGVVRFLDTGIENHMDHGHAYPAKWLQATAIAPLPTHYSATRGNIVIFNDGDASITHIREANMETPGFSPRIIAADEITHHGAAAWLEGGLFAVTFRDEAIPGALPQLVKMLDQDGNVVAEEAAAWVTGIHGDASNSKYAVFGAIEGIVVASSTKQIKLIENIEPLGAGSGNWMGTVKGHDNLEVFYGYARNHGIYRIDPVGGSMSQTYRGNDVKGYFFSSEGTYLILHKSNNEVVIYHAASGEEIKKAGISIATDPNENLRLKSLSDLEAYRLMDAPDPVLTASANYLYILGSDQKSIQVKELETLSNAASFELENPVHNIMRIGFQTQ